MGASHGTTFGGAEGGRPGGADAHAVGRAEDRRRLVIVLVVTSSVVVVELIGAWVSGSLALLADAGHMLTDASAILLALVASVLAARPANPRRTFGYHRAEVLAALVNAVILLAMSTYLVIAGIRRLVDPVEVEARSMLVFAGIGLVANLVSMLVLAARRDSSLNMRAAFLEVFSDTLGSVAAVLAAVVVLLTGFMAADSIASLLIAALIAPRSWALIREAGGVLLEAAPPDLDVDEVRRHLAEAEGVIEVHDLHAWTITSGMPAMSAHVTVSDDALAARGVGAILDELSGCIEGHFGIDHVTLQIEPASHQAHEPGLGHA